MPIKPICFYLPQFHRIPENDRWWGEGFTEWTMVQRANVRFARHRQPKIPARELGYYDLLDPKIRQKQGEIAKAHGIHGFCYYHYWFDGKKLLEKPLEMMLDDGYPDIPFCLCWANESWSRQWYSMDQDVLQEQVYGDLEDWDAHFDYLARYFEHDNYIKVDGKPMFLFYRVGHIPKVEEMIGRWQQRSTEFGWGGLHLVSMLGSFDESNMIIDRIDGVCEFQPSYIRRLGLKFARVNNAAVQSAAEAWRMILDVPKVHPVHYRGVFPYWDNTPRYMNGGIVLIESNPEKFEEFLEKQMRRIQKDDELPEKFLFVNAWNEWSEGCYLEPDQHWECQYLEAIRDALQNHGSLSDISSSDGTRHDEPGAEKSSSNEFDDMDIPSTNDLPAIERVEHKNHARNPLKIPRVDHYYNQARMDVMAAVLKEGVRANKVLEIGCSSGETGRQLKQILDADYYVGIEMSEDAAQKAAENLDRVHVANIETTPLVQLGMKENDFDLLVMLDVLEHLYDPWGVLVDLIDLLKPNGYAVFSIPNVQNVEVLSNLVHGKWNYQGCGLLDSDHVRFFTLESIDDLLIGAGLTRGSIHAHFEPNLDVNTLLDQGNQIHLGKFTLSGITKDEMIRFFIYQYIIFAQRIV